MKHPGKKKKRVSVGTGKGAMLRSSKRCTRITISVNGHACDDSLEKTLAVKAGRCVDLLYLSGPVLVWQMVRCWCWTQMAFSGGGTAVPTHPVCCNQAGHPSLVSYL